MPLGKSQALEVKDLYDKLSDIHHVLLDIRTAVNEMHDDSERSARTAETLLMSISSGINQ